MSKRLPLSMIAAVVALTVARPAVVTRAQAPTAEDLVAKYLQALGGTEALGKLTSRRATGTVTVSTPAGDISGPIELLSKAPNKVRASMTMDMSAMGAGQMEIVQRFDGTTGMMSNSLQGDVEITGTQLDAMRNSVFPTPLLHYKDNGSTIQLLPNDTIDGHPVLVLQLTPKVGPPEKMCFSPDTYLIARTVVHVNNAQIGEVDQVSDPSDYRDVSGVKVPFRLVNTAGGQTVTIVLSAVEHNVPIDDSIFAKH